MNIVDERHAHLASITDQITVTIGKLRAAWGWLRESTEPTRHRWIEREMTPLQREIADARAFAERTYAASSKRVGLSALAPKPAPAALGVLDTRAGIVNDLTGLADELFRTVTGSTDRPAPEPGSRFHLRTCQCRGRGHLFLPSTLGPAWTGCPGRCFTCRSSDPCDCDIPDARVAHALHRIAVALPSIRIIEQARDTLRILRSAERRALNAASVESRPRILIRVECPACAGRTLAVNADSGLEQEWAIECTTPTCRCRGEHCPCGRTIRYRDAPHVWLAANDGWKHLAAALTPDSQTRLEEQVPALDAAAVAGAAA